MVTSKNEQNDESAIRVELRMTRPWTHLFEVSLTAPTAGRECLDFVMPVWTPGSYLIREFARNVQDFTAIDPAGNSLPWEKVRKNLWRVRAGGVKSVTVTYRVLASEISVRTSFLDDSRAFISASSLFFYVDGMLKAPYRLRIYPYSGWARISTGLDLRPGEEATFLAADFDTLVDCPIEVGNHEILRFDVRETPHRVAVTGDGNVDLECLRRDLQRIVETAVDIMGDIPYASYTFLINLVAEGSGGLEHRNSAALQVSRWAFRPEENYRRFLSLAAHEFFHVWNVKRLRPRDLGPFDYGGENYTRLLWVAEGFTDYYGEHILRRANLVTAEQYLEELSRTIRGYMETPGRLVQSVAQASFDAWIKFYRPDAHSANNSISYYVKGHLIGLALDLEIRRRTGNRSLDDVMRLLYYLGCRRQDRGFTERDFREVCESAAGEPLDPLLEDWVHGTGELDLERALGCAGLRFAASKKDPKTPAKSYLGLSVKPIDGRIVVISVTAGAPAYEQGINVNDEILAVDGFRITPELLGQQIEGRLPGTSVDILVSRGGRLRTIPVLLGEKDTAEYQIVRVDSPTEEQKRIYEWWLSAPWS